MAQRQPPHELGLEPAFAWSTIFCVGWLGLGLAALFGAGVPGALLTLSVLHFLALVGLAGAMAEPLPESPSGDKVPLRLKISWGLLGFMPPPNYWTRLALPVGAGGLLCCGGFRET